jgi:hypothetical protein
MTSPAVSCLAAGLCLFVMAGCSSKSAEAAGDAAVVRDSTTAHDGSSPGPKRDGGASHDAGHADVLRDAGVDHAVAPDGGDAAPLCSGLFGNPNAHTGLTLAECSPRCVYAASTFAPPVYDAGFIQGLVTHFAPASPYAPLASDPYEAGVPDADPPAMVCGVLEDPDASAIPRLYALVTYDSADAAVAAGARVTNFGRCGVCSTLANLAVYMADNDLVAPVRACGEQTGGDVDADVTCLEKLGFDLPCAQAWAFDTKHTSSLCLSVCIADLSAPYNQPDGSLDPCIACDEDESGAVFKHVAGRTRRNSGLPNAICRPCSEVQPLVHSY